jgi:hypothetical protein
MMKNLKWLLGNYLEHAAIIGCGGAFMYIFISIAITGGYRAYEPNPFILVSEIGMGVSLVVLGICKVIKQK